MQALRQSQLSFWIFFSELTIRGYSAVVATFAVISINGQSKWQFKRYKSHIFVLAFSFNYIPYCLPTDQNLLAGAFNGISTVWNAASNGSHFCNVNLIGRWVETKSTNWFFLFPFVPKGTYLKRYAIHDLERIAKIQANRLSMSIIAWTFCVLQGACSQLVYTLATDPFIEMWRRCSTDSIVEP